MSPSPSMMVRGELMSIAGEFLKMLSSFCSHRVRGRDYFCIVTFIIVVFAGSMRLRTQMRWL